MGPAEVSIRLIRVKVRAAKAGVRAKYGYFPPNQFNMEAIGYDVKLLSRLGGASSSKKPKGIASDLNVTGQWAVVVRSMMNGTGVLKVYLIHSKKSAHPLLFSGP